MTFDGFVSSAAENLSRLRSPPPLESGRAEHLYDEVAVELRDRMIAASAPHRRAMFQRVFAEVPSQASVLNIGAGGDTTLIEALLSRTPNVLSTDFHERVVSRLRREGHRALAFDLEHATEVIPEPVDCLVGNSVLGFIDPARLQRIVRQLPRLFTRGAVFTFDLAPHGKYFRLADDVNAPPAANESSVSPLVLLDFIRRLGASKGIDAWAHYAWVRNIATDYAVYRAIALLFEAEGCFTRLSRIDNAGVWVLRVAHNPMSSLLELSSLERSFEAADLDAELMKNTVFTPLLYVDRDSGFRLAQALGVSADRRHAAWAVPKFVAEQQNCRRLTSPALRDNVNALQIDQRITRIHEAVRTAVVPTFRPLDKRVALDQTVHKMVLKGESQMSVAQADIYLDTLHTGASARRDTKHRPQKASRRESRR